MAVPIIGAGARARRERSEPSTGDRARAALRKLEIDLRRSFGLWVVLVTTALALWVVSRFAVTEVVLWPDWSANAARAFIVVGSVFAAWSARLTSRDGAPNRVDLLASTATSRVLRELGHAALGAMLALASYGIVAACVLGYAARHATWGGPDVWVVLFGGAASAFFALIGWMMGLLAPGRLTPVVAGAGTFLYTVVSYTWGLTASGLDAIQPWRYIEGRWEVGNRMFYEASSYQGMPHPAGGVLIALGAGAVLLAGYLWVREARRGVVIALAAGALLLVPGWAVANSTDAMPREAPELLANPPMSCGGEVIEVCLHRAYEVQLDDAVAFTEAYYAPLVGVAAIPEVVTQRPYREGAAPAGILPLNAAWSSTPIEQVLARPLGHYLMGGDFEPLNASQNAMLTWLAGQAGVDWFIGPVAELDPVEATSVEWAAYQSEVDAAAERFAALSPGEQRAWLEANWDALRAGELTLGDLP